MDWLGLGWNGPVAAWAKTLPGFSFPLFPWALPSLGTRAVRAGSGFVWTGLDWARIGLTGLTGLDCDWSGMDWLGLGWNGLAVAWARAQGPGPVRRQGAGEGI